MLFGERTDMAKRIFAIIGALITGGLGISLVAIGPQAAYAVLASN